MKNFIGKVGAPTGIHSDNSKMQTSKAWKDVLCRYCIDDSTTEPHCPQQNKAKRTIQELKKNVNRIMDRTETPMSMWLRCMLFATMLMNVLAMKKHDWRTPTEMAFGYTPDVSAFLQFEWWEQVYYLDDDGTGFPNSKEKIGHWCGPTENCGDALT